MSNMTEDKELEELLRKKAAQTWQELKLRQLRQIQEQQLRQRVLTPQDVVKEIKKIVKGSRAEEIIDRAVELYGDTAIRVFEEILKLYRSGRIGELSDYELYQILQQLGLRVPLETRIKIAKRGSEQSIGDLLRSE